jgi:hypothetical protein
MYAALEAFKTYVQDGRDNVKEFFRIGINSHKNFGAIIKF